LTLASDSLIAAKARAHGLALVTRNVDDFIASGMEIVNPWEE
jgi:predicted nucleic acid-binding protein